MDDASKLHLRSVKVSSTIRGKMLAHAFVIARNEGCTLSVLSIDGQTMLGQDRSTYDPRRLNVDVVQSIVKKVWVG